MSFNIKELKKDTSVNSRYERRLAALNSLGQDVSRIKLVIENAVLNINNGQKSFVIYGEPQSGKTEMMIALTAKLLDEGSKIIVILLNDSVQLLNQNLERFQRSGLSPSPKKFNEILSPEVHIGSHQWVLFCKKNSQDLKKLLLKVGPNCSPVLIDDEADYATPNSKINLKEKSKINELTGKLIGKNGIYIGVTATPARLDLNRTHENEKEHWIDFPVHSNYTGQDVFFPIKLDKIPYRLTFLPDSGDDPKYLREALFSFMVNVGFLNSAVNSIDSNYSILIHTSGKKSDHSVDFKQIVKLIEAIREEKHRNHETFIKRLWEIAKERYPGNQDSIARYILSNCDRNNVVVMNSDKEVNAADNRTATDPTAPFTIIIGGNIVSRGVTFTNLLSMFFTRDVKHKLQQDTYIQRARMFGSRGAYLPYFELTIPKSLYLDWQKCFIFHRLSLQSRKQDNKSPVWLDGERITSVSSSSISKTSVSVEKGEMSFSLFDYDATRIKNVLSSEEPPIQKAIQLADFVGSDGLPSYLLDFIQSFSPEGDKSLVIHMPFSIDGYTDKQGELNKATITRKRGFIGKRELEPDKYSDAIHHLFILYNSKLKARFFYKYEGNIRFLKTSKK
ncbi:MAG TPA: Z1 domain-containing protein [Puia sp.]|nr:Z1 domain-containing protein [Puia sp.]